MGNVRLLHLKGTKMRLGRATQMDTLKENWDVREFFIVTTSFAAPFFSDTDHYYQQADTPEQALKLLAQRYGHPGAALERAEGQN